MNDLNRYADRVKELGASDPIDGPKHSPSDLAPDENETSTIEHYSHYNSINVS